MKPVDNPNIGDILPDVFRPTISDQIFIFIFVPSHEALVATWRLEPSKTASLPRIEYKKTMTLQSVNKQMVAPIQQ